MSNIPLMAGPEAAVQGPEPAPQQVPLTTSLGAFMRRENSILSALDSQMGAQGEPDPGFNLLDHIRGTPNEANFQYYLRAGAFNRARALQVDRQLEMERQNKEAADLLPWYLALPAGVAAGITDPSVLLPGGGLVRAVRGGYSMARSAGSVAAATSAAVGVQEALLQTTQLTRPLEESLVNVGAGVLLGGFLGAGAARFLSGAEAAQTARGVRQVYMDDAASPLAIQDMTPARQREWETASPARRAELADSLRYEVPETPMTRPADVTGFAVKGIADIQRTLDDVATLTDKVNTTFLAVARTAEDLEAGRFAIVAQTDQADVIARMRDAYPERRIIAADELSPASALEPPTREAYVPTSGGDLSAASARTLEPEDTQLVGNLAKAMADKLQWLSPNIRQSINPMHGLREQWLKLVESPLLFKGSLPQTYTAYENGVPVQVTRAPKAVAPGGAATRRMELLHSDALRTVAAMDEVYQRMVKSGIQMPRSEFMKKVGDAQWYSRIDDNPFVEEAAELEQKHYNYLFDNGVQARIYRRDIDGGEVEGVDRYYPRDADRNVFVQHRDVFINRVAPWWERRLEQQYVEATNQLENKIRFIQDKIDFLRMSPEEAQRELALLAEQAAAAGGAQRRRLAGLMSQVRQTEGGRALAQEAVQNRIDQIYEQAERSLESIVSAGRRLERELAAYDTRVEAREEFQEKLRDTLFKEHRKLEKLIEKTEERIAKQELKFQQALDGERSLAAGTSAAGKIEELTAQLNSVRAQRAELDTIRAQTELLDEFQTRFDARFPGATPEERLDLVRDGIQFAVARTNQLNLQRGAKVRELAEKMGKLDPALVRQRQEKMTAQIDALRRDFDERWRYHNGAEPDFRALASDIANDLADAYSGLRTAEFDKSNVPVEMTTFTRGPLKRRTNITPNEVMDPPGAEIQFFRKDSDQVMMLHSRRVTGQIAIGQMFNGDYRLEQVFGSKEKKINGALNDQLALYRGYVDRATSAEEVYRVSGMKPKRNESLDDAKVRARTWLNDWRTSAKKDFINAYQALSGTLYAKEQMSDLGMVARIAKQLAYIRVMGGQAIAMFTDLYIPAMVLGLRNHFTQGVLPLATSKAIREMAKPDLEFMGLALNHVVNRNVMAMADIGDPMARGNVVERVLDKMTGIASRWNGSQYLQDASETLAGMTTMRLLMQRVRDFDTWSKDLTDMGIDPAMAQRIVTQIDRHKKEYQGVEFPNLSAWTDDGASFAFRAGVARQVDSIFATRRIGNTPWVMSHPIGGVILQFQSYNIVQSQSVLMRGLQDNQKRLLLSLAPLTMMGAAVAYVQAVLRGGESLEKFERNMQQNPGFLIAEGLDRGSPFPLAFTAANLFESATRAAGPDSRINPIKDAIMAPFGPLPDELKYVPQGRDFVTQLLGPTAGAIGQLPAAVGGIAALATGGELSGSQAGAIQRSLPYGTYPGMRQAVQWLYDDLPGGM